jgi:hypothetical protein
MPESPPVPTLPPPKGLRSGSRKFWKTATAGVIWRPDELILLENACKTMDLVEQLDAAMDGQPLVVPGSLGQLREHPLLSEARQQRAALARLLAQLKYPEPEMDAHSRTAGERSSAARKLAAERWSRRGA